MEIPRAMTQDLRYGAEEETDVPRDARGEGFGGDLFQLYLSQIAEIPLIARDEELKLAR